MTARNRRKLSDNPPAEDPEISDLYQDLCGDAGGEFNLTPSQRRLAWSVARAEIVANRINPHESARAMQLFNSMTNTVLRGYRSLALDRRSDYVRKDMDDRKSNSGSTAYSNLDEYLKAMSDG